MVVLIWKPPDLGWFKLNIDGGRRSDGSISTGGIIRNSKGTWIQGFKSLIGREEVIDAELWGFLLGLILAADLGLRKLVVETDCLEMKGWSQREQMFEEIRFLLSQFEACEVCHVYREQNKVANMLIQNCVGPDPFCFYFPQPPSDVSILCSINIWCLGEPRVIKV